MQVPLVMTVIGRDRPGLVETVASLVAAHGGNWLESRMCRLGGEFAGILRVHVESSQQAALTDALKQLEVQGLTMVIRPDREGAPEPSQELASLEIVGQDRPGIVRQIANALARRGVNVEELKTECASAPMSGETLFKAQAKLSLPVRCDVAALRQELGQMADDMLIDLTFERLGRPT